MEHASRHRFLLSALIGIASLLAAVPHGMAEDRAKLEKDVIEARLTHVQEVRRAMLAGFNDENATFEFNRARLELTFRVTPPAGKQLVDIEQPQTIKAVDSTGRDLSDIKPTFMDRTEYVKLAQSWGKPAEEVIMTLAPPARNADNFSVTTDFHLWAFDKVAESKFTVNSTTAPLTGTVFHNTKVSAHVQGDENTVRLVFQPGSIKRHIEGVELFDGSTVHKTNGSMWNDQTLTYMFNASLKPTFEVRARIRSGLDTYPCRIEVANHQLP